VVGACHRWQDYGTVIPENICLGCENYRGRLVSFELKFECKLYAIGGTLSSWWVRIVLSALLCFFIVIQSVLASTKKKQKS